LYIDTQNTSLFWNKRDMGNSKLTAESEITAGGWEKKGSTFVMLIFTIGSKWKASLLSTSLNFTEYH
jgi:hypothetical protein